MTDNFLGNSVAAAVSVSQSLYEAGDLVLRGEFDTAYEVGDEALTRLEVGVDSNDALDSLINAGQKISASGLLESLLKQLKDEEKDIAEALEDFEGAGASVEPDPED
jgi:hypothetical protein